MLTVLGNEFKAWGRWWWRYGLRYSGIVLFILAFLPRSTLLLDRWNLIALEISAWQFDYIRWEIGALAAKTQQTLYGLHPFMEPAAQTEFVRAYMGDLARAQHLEAQINNAYADALQPDPATYTAEWRAERDLLRAALAARQATLEAVLEGQVAAVLVEQGFGFGGQLLPPMAMRFTQVPNLLVVSPRERIALDVSLNLYALPIDQITALETRLDQQYDISTLIVPLGGIALYPAMITETASIERAVEVFAHEWLHHYLYFYPLGLSYFTGGDALASEARIINETTADLFGREVARLVLARYYPDLLPPLITTPATPPTSAADRAPVFDFGAAMHETRVTVDALLAAGNVTAAETYMETRRLYFRENGYVLRKLNQAFFAFYGGYQGGAVPGIGGADPIGPAVRAVRTASPSLYTFVARLREVRTRAELLELVPTMP
jgi:hypothetical protein